MKHIYVPTTGPEDWKRLLAEPEKQWRAGFSAKTLAQCWEQADGFPPEIEQLFRRSGVAAFERMDLILALPEYQVPLPGGARPSQNDLFVLAKGGDDQLVAITVEGKVAEPFGPTLEEWDASQSRGKQERIAFILKLLGVDGPVSPRIRYQLLHRTASAIIEARRFNARSAVMLVHSFSPECLWFEDFAAFVELYSIQPEPGRLYFLKELEGVGLYAGWAKGDRQFLEA